MKRLSLPTRVIRTRALPFFALAAALACSSNKNEGSSAGAVSGEGGASSNGGASSGDGASAGTSSGGSSASTGGTSNGGSSASTGGTSSGGTASSTGGSTGAGGSTTVSMGTPSAKALAAKLGRSHFLIGMGNDLNNDHDMDGAYTLGTTLDVHYAYLTGLSNMNNTGWPDWNTDGSFVNILTDSAKSHGVIPMFTTYGMAAKGENNLSVLTDDTYMGDYWDTQKLMFQRLAMFGGPALVNFEPDFWGFTQQATKNNDPSTVAVHVTAHAPDCASLSDDLVGLGKCLVLLARKYAPKVVVGFHASAWANGDPTKIASFLVAIGAGDADFMTTDTLDRDAGCYEAGTDPNCQRGGSGYYWSDTDFQNHLTWVKAMTDGVKRPMLWWQTPFGVPSDTPGGTPGHYRDNRVQYIFSHVNDFIAAGGVGAVFGTGAGNQTYIDSDGDQFKNAVSAYFAAPVALQ